MKSALTPDCAQDDLRTELSLAYNHPEVSTPHLDALTKKSMVFQNAYCQQPICSPSRNSFMSGEYTTAQHNLISRETHDTTSPSCATT